MKAVGLTGVFHQLRGHALELQPGIELPALLRVHPLVLQAVDHQGGSSGVVQVRQGRALPVQLGLIVPVGVPMDQGHFVGDVGGPGERYPVGQPRGDDRRLEALAVAGGGPGGVRFEGLRSDDIFTLIPDVLLRPAELGLDGGFTSIAFALLVVCESIVLAVLLAFVTYRLGGLIASVVAGPAPLFTFPAARSSGDRNA